MDWRRTPRFEEVLAQVQAFGADAAILVAVLGFLSGMILAFEQVFNVHHFGTPILLLPTIVTQTAAQRICPMLAAMVLAGRSGSVFAADVAVHTLAQEASTRRIDREVPGLERAPRDFALSRVMALAIAGPLLTMIAISLAILGGGLICSQQIGLSLSRYLVEVQGILNAANILKGPLKGLVFSLVIGCACYLTGRRVHRTGHNVLQVPATAAVHSIALVVVADTVFTYLYPG